MTKTPHIAPVIGRSVTEWIGANPDARPPNAVLLRILRRFAYRCHISGREITDGTPWEAEHIKPLWAGGMNRESNLAPALVDPHKVKTAEEAGRRSKADRQAGKAFIRQKPTGANKLQGRDFPKFEKPRRGVDKSALPPLPRIDPMTRKPI